MDLKLPPTYKNRNAGCGTVTIGCFIIIFLLTFCLGCTKQPIVEPTVEQPQTISITINNNTSSQILVK